MFIHMEWLSQYLMYPAFSRQNCQKHHVSLGKHWLGMEVTGSSVCMDLVSEDAVHLCSRSGYEHLGH